MTILFYGADEVPYGCAQHATTRTSSSVDIKPSPRVTGAVRGDPYLMRLMAPAVFGFGGPKRKIRGRDFAGRSSCPAAAYPAVAASSGRSGSS